MTGWKDGINRLEFHHHGNSHPWDDGLCIISTCVIPNVHGCVTDAKTCFCILHFDEDLATIKSWDRFQVKGYQTSDVEVGVTHGWAFYSHNLPSANNGCASTEECAIVTTFTHV